MKTKKLSLGVKISTLGLLVFFLGLVIIPTSSPSAGGPAGATEQEPTVTKSQDNAALASMAPSQGSQETRLQEAAEGRPVHTPEKVKKNGHTFPIRTYRPLATPNDPRAQQWWVSKIGASNVWDNQPSSDTTTLAIIDTGFALAHEEFSGRWALNAAETGPAQTEAPSALNCTARSLPLDASCNLIDDDRDGTIDNETGPVTYENPSRRNCSDQLRPLTKDCNRIDDDANGYIDDVRGWDFMHNDNSAQAGELNPAGDGVTHGTMVAGVAAATGNNGVGVAGVNWTTKILPLQAIDDDSYGDTLSVGDAIYYAVSRDVDVISLSLGSSLPDEYVRQAVQAALAKGIVVVAASGNDGCECIVYPARYPEVLAVGALNTNDTPVDFSSWGSALDILAPGVDIATASWSASQQTSAYVTGVNGTSFATPLVGGLVARLIAEQPQATPGQIIAAITGTTNRLTLGGTTSRSNVLGYGLFKADSALYRMKNPAVENLMYAFSGVQTGSYFTDLLPAEPAGLSRVYQCSSRPGNQPIYEVTKSSQRFFTINEVERIRAEQRGYTSSLFAYGCVQQQHDVPAAVRNLDVFREFRNITQKQ